MEKSKKSSTVITVLQIALPVIGTIIAAYFGYLGIKLQIDAPIRTTQTAIAMQSSNTQELGNTPTVSANQTVELDLPYLTSFEDLNLSQPTEIYPFIYIGKNDMFTGTYSGIQDYTSWTVDSRARTGKIALNAIPNGNPSTTNVILNPVFDVSNMNVVLLRVWVNSTSNPRSKTIHNCESNLNVYYKTDSNDWTHGTAICGAYKTESIGWWEVTLDIDVSRKSTIQFAFVYEVQNVTEPDPTAYFLIDDIVIERK